MKGEERWGEEEPKIGESKSEGSRFASVLQIY
jgi:hypothetical protein